MHLTEPLKSSIRYQSKQVEGKS